MKPGTKASRAHWRGRRVLGTLSAEEIQDVILASNPTYQAAKDACIHERARATKRGSEKSNNTADMWIVFDTSKQGLETVMKDYRAMVMRFLWQRGEEGTISRDAWLHVNKLLMEEVKSISRGSIIRFMNDMVDAGVLHYTEEPGIGGHHRVYFPAYDEKGLKLHVAKTIISKLFEAWPEATREAIEAHAR